MSVVSIKSAPPAPLKLLSQAWLKAKQDEKDANARRLEVEQQILEQTSELAVAEGTATAEAEGFVIKIGFGMNRSIDEVKLAAEVASALPEDTLRRLFVYQPKLDLKELRYLQANAPEHYLVAAKCITTKPAKPSISVQEANS